MGLLQKTEAKYKSAISYTRIVKDKEKKGFIDTCHIGGLTFCDMFDNISTSINNFFTSGSITSDILISQSILKNNISYEKDHIIINQNISREDKRILQCIFLARCICLDIISMKKEALIESLLRRTFGDNFYNNEKIIKRGEKGIIINLDFTSSKYVNSTTMNTINEMLDNTTDDTDFFRYLYPAAKNFVFDNVTDIKSAIKKYNNFATKVNNFYKNYSKTIIVSYPKNNEVIFDIDSLSDAESNRYGFKPLKDVFPLIKYNNSLFVADTSIDIVN